MSWAEHKEASIIGVPDALAISTGLLEGIPSKLVGNWQCDIAYSGKRSNLQASRVVESLAHWSNLQDFTHLSGTRYLVHHDVRIISFCPFLILRSTCQKISKFVWLKLQKNQTYKHDVW